MSAGARAAGPERAIVAAAARYLERQGYRTWADIDGNDYFDLIARRGDEVGLVEAKVADARTVLTQALVRRAWGDWGAVILGSRRAALRLEGTSRGSRAEPVGIWWAEGEHVLVARAARPWPRPPGDDPFAVPRTRLRAALDALERGEVPRHVAWSGVVSTIRSVSGGRRFREWRLDEELPPSDPSGSDPPA
jgi:hypothetical protein